VGRPEAYAEEVLLQRKGVKGYKANTPINVTVKY